MKKIFCLTLLSVAAFGIDVTIRDDPIQYFEQRIQQQEMQMQQKIATYQKIYENSTKEKQLDECADELYAAKLGEKCNPTPCLDYMNPRK